MPWLREAALILAIHSLRMSRLRARRSRYAYSSACMTASLAGRKSVRCVIRKPLARFRIFLCRRRAGTLRLTRGISGLVLHIGGRAAQTPGILTGQHEQLAVLPLAARALVAQQVALLRVRAHDLAALGHAEPLGRRAMGTKLRHRSPLEFFRAGAGGGGGAWAAAAAPAG